MWRTQREIVFYDEITCHKGRKKSDIHEGSEVSVVSSSTWSNAELPSGPANNAGDSLYSYLVNKEAIKPQVPPNVTSPEPTFMTVLNNTQFGHAHIHHLKACANDTTYNCLAT